MVRRVGPAALTVLALAASSALGGPPEEGDRAPNVTATTWWNLPKGVKRVTLNDLKGQVVLVEFWATW